MTAVAEESAPALSKAAVQLPVENERRPVAVWTSDDNLHLAILIDDAVARGAADRWGDLRQFILAQPATTHVGVACLRNHVAVMAQDFTTDHEAAAAALRGTGAATKPTSGTGRTTSPAWPTRRAEGRTRADPGSRPA